MYIYITGLQKKEILFYLIYLLIEGVNIWDSSYLITDIFNFIAIIYSFKAMEFRRGLRNSSAVKFLIRNLWVFGNSF